MQSKDTRVFTVDGKQVRFDAQIFNKNFESCRRSKKIGVLFFCFSVINDSICSLFGITGSAGVLTENVTDTVFVSDGGMRFVKGLFRKRTR